jgi:hypothetical protein
LLGVCEEDSPRPLSSSEAPGVVGVKEDGWEVGANEVDEKGRMDCERGVGRDILEGSTDVPG